MSDTYTPSAPASFPTTIEVPATTDPVTGGVGGAANVAGEDNADNIQWLYEQRFEDYKDRIENESGGHLTARQDDLGTVDLFYVMQPFKPSWLSNYGNWDSGKEHRAFYKNTVLQKQILVSVLPAYEQTIDGTPSLVQNPSKAPSLNTMANFRTRVANKGSAYHLMTAYEYGALCLEAYAVTDRMHGNTEYGKFDTGAVHAEDFGKLIDPVTPTYTYPGSGPLAWRHNLSPWGVADLIGNYTEFIEGIKTIGTEIYLMGLDNNYDLAEGSWIATGIHYKDSGGALVLDTSSTTTLTITDDFQDITLTAALLAASNPYAESVLVDAMISAKFEDSGSSQAPGIMQDATGLIDLTISSAIESNYYAIGGDYTDQTDAGGGARKTLVSSSGTATCRYCLVE